MKLLALPIGEQHRVLRVYEVEDDDTVNQIGYVVQLPEGNPAGPAEDGVDDA